jgi:hypothetical protein
VFRIATGRASASDTDHIRRSGARERADLHNAKLQIVSLPERQRGQHQRDAKPGDGAIKAT